MTAQSVSLGFLDISGVRALSPGTDTQLLTDTSHTHSDDPSSLHRIRLIKVALTLTTIKHKFCCHCITELSNAKTKQTKICINVNL